MQSSVYLFGELTPPMKLLILPLLALCLTSCAGFTGLGSATTVYNANGKPILTTSGEHRALAFHQTPTETTLVDGTMSHTKATAAQWAGINGNIDAFGNLATKAADAYVRMKNPVSGIITKP